MATPAVLKHTSVQRVKHSRTASKTLDMAQTEFSAPPALRRKPLLQFVHRERTRHGKVVYYFRKTQNAKRIRLPDDYGSPVFIAAYQHAMTGEPSPVATIKSPDIVPRGRIGQALSVSLAKARQRAKARGLPFDLDYDWLISQVEMQELSCALTGIKFFSNWSGASTQRNPTTPSIDRIIPSKGYVKSNCRVVTIAINTMLLDWGEELFLKMANAYRRHRTAPRRTA